MTSKPSRSAEALATRLQKTLAANVKRHRESLGMTTRDLAAAVETSQRRIVMIETAVANPTILTLARLSVCLKVSVVDLLAPAPRAPKP